MSPQTASHTAAGCAHGMSGSENRGVLRNVLRMSNELCSCFRLRFRMAVKTKKNSIILRFVSKRKSLWRVKRRLS